MIYKILIPLILMQTLCFSAYQQISIGKIDRQYEDKITNEQLRVILNEIEDMFESTMGVNVFDYSPNGKPIDIIYLPPSQMEKRFKRKLNRFEKKKEKIKSYEQFFYESQEKIDVLRDELNYKNSILNSKVEDLNKYINSKNKLTLSKEQYEKVVNTVNSRKKKINKELKEFKKEQRALNRLVTKYNNKIHLYNSNVNEINRLSYELETMNRGFKKVKGRAFTQKEITLKTYYKNGEKTVERSVRENAKKIEIYGFNSLAELKVVLAHEIGHLVGLPHIEIDGALMNPILQKNQEEELYLTPSDIRNFNINF